ncbi:MAG: hypothetical protein LLG42_12180 [Chloroflexi bacterium]|nr:hypothetical protein [Chloroflexota bacterium]
MIPQTPPEKSGFVRFISILLIVVFISSSVLAVLLFNMNTVLLNRETYKKVLLQQDVYHRIPALAAEQITGTAATENCVGDACRMESVDNLAYSMQIPAAYLASLDQTGWESIFSVLMPADWLQTQTEGVIDQIFDGLNSADQPIRAIISLESRRIRLSDGDYQKISRTVLDTAPVCNAEELLTLAAILLGGTSANLPFCTPTEEFRPWLETTMDTAVRNVIQSLPAEITINAGTLINTSPEIVQPGETMEKYPFNRIKWMRLGFMLSPLMPLFLLVLIGAVAVRSWRDAGRWLGIPLLISGIIVMVIAALVLLTSPWLVSNVLLPQFTIQIGPGILQLIQDVVQSITLRYVFWNGLAACILLLIGAGFLLISVLHKPKRV